MSQKLLRKFHNEGIHIQCVFYDACLNNVSVHIHVEFLFFLFDKRHIRLMTVAHSDLGVETSPTWCRL